jgi:hypothetical protein
MSEESQRAVKLPDVVGTLLLLVVFAYALIASFGWPFRTAFFPQFVSGAGILFAVLKLAGFGVAALRGRAAAAVIEPEVPVIGDTALVNEEEEDDRSVEYVFATAGRGAWAVSLGWIAGFFVLLYVAGVFIAVPVFTFAYLKVSGGAGWLGAAIYAVVAWLVLWLAFSVLLTVPMPTGLF